MVTEAERQRSVCKWAAEHIQRRDFVICDTETSGIDETAEVLQIVVVNAWGKVAFSSLVRPVEPIDEAGRAFEVNGISNQMMLRAPYPSAIGGIFAGFALCSVIAYNADFDSRMVRQTFGYRAQGWECAMKQFAQYAGEPGRYGDYKWHKLQSACAQFGLCLSRNWHDAAADALATYDLIAALADRYLEEEGTS